MTISSLLMANFNGKKVSENVLSIGLEFIELAINEIKFSIGKNGLIT